MVGINIRNIVSMYVDIIMYPPVQLLYTDIKFSKLKKRILVIS
jgi:large-conductance mechanosensitive channel